MTGWQGHFIVKDATGAVLATGDTTLAAGGPGACVPNLSGRGSGSAVATLSYRVTIAGGVPASGTAFVNLSYVLVGDSVSGSRFAETFDGVTLTGTVLRGPSSLLVPVAGAAVQLCALPPGPCSLVQTTAADGAYSFPGVNVSVPHILSATPPAGSGLLPNRKDVRSSPASLVIDLRLSDVKLPPAGTTIVNSGTNADGVPIILWHDPLKFTTTECPGAVPDGANYQIIAVLGGRSDPPLAFGGLIQGPLGVYTGSSPALYPFKGYATVVSVISCPGVGGFITTIVAFNIFVDPSGTVRTTAGEPVVGATVTLLRSEAGGPFVAVANGSALLSPDNRRNPDTTGVDGRFGWDVVAGTYQVRAERAGCVSPSDPTQPFVLSPVLVVPPAAVNVDLRLSCSAADSTAPITVATASPAANAAGWNNGDVTIGLIATDEAGGSGVRQITYSATGAQPIAATTVLGAATSITIGTEGDTTVSYFATDNAGNAATPRTIAIRIDRTNPTITGASLPAANAGGWNKTDVLVSFTCLDARSGIATCSGPVTLSSEGADQTVTGTASDNAGNTASATVAHISIDKTAPRTTATRTPAANAAGWNRGPVTVALAATDALSGVALTEVSVGTAPFAAYTGPLTISADGVSVIRYRSTDRAGNVEADQMLTLQIDRTAPEASIGFDPATADLAVTGSDALSGVPAGAIAPAISARAHEGTVRRTYIVTDRAGNTLTIVIDVKREGHELKAEVVSLSYNGGAAIAAPRNGLGFEWSLQGTTLRELEQKIEVDAGKARTEVEAKFEAKRNETRITVETPEPERHIVRPGLVLVQLITDRGSLSIAY